MTEHNLFYYPYASFTDEQLPLLKVAALYFDKLFILDPVDASWDTIGTSSYAIDAMRQLKGAGILEIVRPATVLAKYETSILKAMHRDMGDLDFLKLCEAKERASGKKRWTLSLAKVPQDVKANKTMQKLMGPYAKQVSRHAGQCLEQTGANPGPYYEFAKSGRTYNETNPGDGDIVDYRVIGEFADFPLALGEAIMMNHALFGGLLHACATPIADDPFHSKALSLKLRRAAQDPVVQEAQAKRAQVRQLYGLRRGAESPKADIVAFTALKDPQLKLPVLSAKLPLAEVLEYRQKHEDDLRQAREKLGWMARRIEAEPWSDEFAKELEHKTIPDIAEELKKAERARDSWLKSGRARSILKGTGFAAGTALAALTLFTTPATPITLALGGLGLIPAAVPGAEWLLDWLDGKKTMQENGLHYLLTT